MSKYKPTTRRVLDILSEISPDDEPISPNMGLHDAKLYAGQYRDEEDEQDQGLKRCHSNGKLCFPSSKAAALALRRIQRKRNHYLRVYFCPDCKHYHLSSSKRP